MGRLADLGARQHEVFFRDANGAPAVVITSPSGGSSYPEGASITFAGSATDTQDGTLTASLRSTSSLAGEIGTGGWFSRTLPAAAVTDSGGLTGSSQIMMTVTVSAQTNLLLSATGYKVKGLQNAELKGSGFSSATVDIYRNGAR